MSKALEERVADLERQVAALVRILETMSPRPMTLEEQHCFKMAARAKAKEA